jgi:hypothetical protein
MRREGHLICIWEGGVEACIGFLWRNPRERDHLGNPGVDGRINLEWNFRKRNVGYGLD